MKNRYRLISRGSRGGAFYCVDGSTGKRTSLGACSRDEAEQVVSAKNQSLRQPALNLQIARAYPERFAQQALGHNSKAVHRAYAKNALVELPCLSEYEQKLVPFRKSATDEPLAKVNAAVYEEEGKYSMSVALKKKERKIDSLAQGFSFPFYVQYFIRVWDRSETGLQAKCAAVKNAVNQMNGAQVYESALPTTAKKLFFSTWPGWTGSSYRHRDLYAEDRYLADLLPFSSTFTAHLAEAEAIYDGTNGNLAGVRTFIGGTPQHAVLIGMTGAGKSFAMDDLLTQTQAGYDYTVIIEEGLSYKKFTENLGGRPILIHPDGELTINYLDTQGLPLNQLQIATAVALVSKMIGESPDPEKQQLRQAQIGQYIHQLYSDTFTEWAAKHHARISKDYAPVPECVQAEVAPSKRIKRLKPNSV